MAIPAVLATPFSLALPADIAQVRGVLVRETERNLFVPDTAFPLVETVEISETSRLLSSMAELSETAISAEAGNPLDNQSVIDDAQRFVDSVNAINVAAQFDAGRLFDLASDDVPSVSPPESLGIGIVPTGGAGNTFLVTLDNQVLEGALEVDPAGTARQLASFALPLGTQVTTQRLQEGLLPDSSSIEGSPALSAIAVANVRTEALRAADTSEPVVPDLLEVNTELRRALADTALTDTLTDALAGMPDTTILPLVIPSPLTTEADMAVRVREDAPDADGTMLTEPRSVPPIQPSTIRDPLPLSSQVAAPVLTPAAEPPLAVLTTDELLSTPLEQIARLATNPTLGAAVAAFQITGDDRARNAKVTLQSDFDVVNPLEAVLQTEAIGPNLANTGEQHRDGSTDSRLSKWLATRLA